jgi:hypothetical protein
MWSRVRLLTDAIALYFAAGAALFAATSIRVIPTSRWLAAIFPLIVLVVLRGRRSPDERMFGSIVETEGHVMGAVSLSAMLILAGDLIVGGAHPVGLALRLVFSVVYLGIARAVLLAIRRQAIRSHALATPTLIVGAGVVGEHLAKRLVEEPRYGLRPVGFLDSDPLPRPARDGGLAVPVLGGPDDLVEAITRTGARQVILAFTSEPDRALVEKVRECERLGVEVSPVPRLYESINERAMLDHVGGVPLLSLHSVDPRGWQFAVRHALDRTFALVALIASAPVMVAIAITVKLSSPGPILFRWRRVGRDGHEFDVLKFRTMAESPTGRDEFVVPDGCAPGGVEGVDRQTPIGRYLRDLSLDELPHSSTSCEGT